MLNKDFWGHVSTIILSERLLRQDIKDSIDFINRYREIRYNILLYATKEPIDDILKTKAFLHYRGCLPFSMNQRKGINNGLTYNLNNFINLLEIVIRWGKLLISHHLKFQQKIERRIQKAPLLRNDGAFFVRNNRLEGWLSETDLNGLRWMDEKTFDLLCGLLRMIALLFP